MGARLGTLAERLGRSRRPPTWRLAHGAKNHGRHRLLVHRPRIRGKVNFKTGISLQPSQRRPDKAHSCLCPAGDPRPGYRVQLCIWRCCGKPALRGASSPHSQRKTDEWWASTNPPSPNPGEIDEATACVPELHMILPPTGIASILWRFLNVYKSTGTGLSFSHDASPACRHHRLQRRPAPILGHMQSLRGATAQEPTVEHVRR